MSNELQTIDPAALAQVSGGTTVTTGNATTTTTTNDQILASLNGILTSIQGLAQPQNTGFNQTEMLMLFMLMQQRSQPVYYY
jgi:hypothetical protein